MATAIDPVCKMRVDTEKPAATAEYKGKMYYFCASGCKAAFEANPGKYITEEPGTHGENHTHDQSGN